MVMDHSREISATIFAGINNKNKTVGAEFMASGGGGSACGGVMPSCH
jgi:hypothetical protein